jgi:hypothetical protein
MPVLSHAIDEATARATVQAHDGDVGAAARALGVPMGRLKALVKPAGPNKLSLCHKLHISRT